MPGLNFPNAITDEKDFYGRGEGLRQIENTFLYNLSVPVLIIGERRTGKTSLMNIALRRLTAMTASAPEAESRTRFTFLPVEPRGITTFHAFARSILLRMRAHIRTSLREKGSGADRVVPEIAISEFEAIEQFEAQFKDLLQYCGQETFLVCIDEFDEIVSQARGPELARILGLIYALIERAELPVGFFFTMTSVPEAMKEERPSTLIAMAQVIDLRPFEPEDADRLVINISGDRLDWTEASLRQLYRICGGHPYFTKLVLAHMLIAGPASPESGAPVPVVQDMLDDAVCRARNDPRTDHVFENLYNVHFSAAEKEILLQLARREMPLPGRDLAAVGAAWVTAARRLVKRHYLVEEASGFNFKAAFLGEWLRNWIAFEEECAEYTTLQIKLVTPKEIVVDIAAGQVAVLGIPVRLSAQEFAILDFLAERAEQLVRREELVDRIWGTDQGVSDQMIDTAFYRLRKKIGDHGQYIETIPGQGFKLHRATRISDASRKNFNAREGGAD